MSIAESLVRGKLQSGFCLIHPIEQEFSSLLVKPDKVDVRQGYGQVVNAAEPIGFQSGDYVIYDRVRGAEIDGGDCDLNYVRNDHVLCVVE